MLFSGELLKRLKAINEHYYRQPPVTPDVVSCSLLICLKHKVINNGNFDSIAAAKNTPTTVMFWYSEKLKL